MWETAPARDDSEAELCVGDDALRAVRLGSERRARYAAAVHVDRQQETGGLNYGGLACGAVSAVLCEHDDGGLVQHVQLKPSQSLNCEYTLRAAQQVGSGAAGA
eukprot:gene21705-32707_t